MSEVSLYITFSSSQAAAGCSATHPTARPASRAATCTSQGPGCRVQGSGCRVQGSGFRIHTIVLRELEPFLQKLGQRLQCPREESYG